MGSRPISSSSGGCCRERQNRTANTETPPRIARERGCVQKPGRAVGPDRARLVRLYYRDGGASAGIAAGDDGASHEAAVHALRRGRAARRRSHVPHSCFYRRPARRPRHGRGPRRQPRTGGHTVRLQGSHAQARKHKPVQMVPEGFLHEEPCGVPQEHHQGDGARRYCLGCHAGSSADAVRHPAGDDLDHVGSPRDGCQRPVAHGGGRLLRHRRRGLSFSEMAVHQEPYDVER